MTLAEMEKEYGTVDYQGKKYYLTECASVDNYQDGIRYSAIAVDTDGKEYMVEWDTTDEWNEALSDADRIRKDYESNPTPSYELPAILEDEFNACDWDNPVEVKGLF